LRSYSKESLIEFNGENNKPIYVAYNRNVYDVSDSLLWKDGKHMGAHRAGYNLTNIFKNAPHDSTVFTKFTIVGEMEDENHQENLATKISRLAPHPMLVHFPIAYGVLVPVLAIFYIATGIVSFESASYYVLVFGLLASPVCALSGFISWSQVYKRKRSNDFTKKIWLCIGLVIFASICVVWRTLYPDVLVVGNGLSYLYLVFEMMIAVFVSLLGHIGGKIVFST